MAENPYESPQVSGAKSYFWATGNRIYSLLCVAAYGTAIVALGGLLFSVSSFLFYDQYYENYVRRTSFPMPMPLDALTAAACYGVASVSLFWFARRTKRSSGATTLQSTLGP